MVTGASTANLAILLVDARKGVIEQTCRHAFIANLLRIQHIVVCVNKMDLVDWSEDTYNEIVAAFKKFASRLDNIVEITFIPVSALLGDNIVDKSNNMPWYQGPAMLYHLETVYIGADQNHVEARMPVQWVIRRTPTSGMIFAVRRSHRRRCFQAGRCGQGYALRLRFNNQSDPHDGWRARGSFSAHVGRDHAERRDRHLAR